MQNFRLVARSEMFYTNNMDYISSLHWYLTDIDNQWLGLLRGPEQQVAIHFQLMLSYCHSKKF